MAKIKELSVFFPAYNEQDNLKATVEKARVVLQKVAQDYEIIIVDDGSQDKTGAVADALARSRDNIRVIHHPRNRGYGAALKSGLYAAKYPWIVFTDADGQFDFAEITRFLETQQQTAADLVIGYYLKRQVPFYRILGSKIWQLTVWALFGLNVKDIDCGFKLLRRGVMQKIPKLEAERGPFISSELLIKAKNAGFKIAELGVHHYPRRKGFATGASYGVVIAGFKDLWRLRGKLKNEQKN